MFGNNQCSYSLPMTFSVNVAVTLVQISNQVRILGVTLDSRLSFHVHISSLSNSCFYLIRALRTSVPISHSTAQRTMPVLSSPVISIMSTGPSWGSRLIPILGFNVCKARSHVLSHIRMEASVSPRLYRSSIGFIISGA